MIGNITSIVVYSGFHKKRTNPCHHFPPSPTLVPKPHNTPLPAKRVVNTPLLSMHCCIFLCWQVFRSRFHEKMISQGNGDEVSSENIPELETNVSVFEQTILSWQNLQEWAQKAWAKRYQHSPNGSTQDVKPITVQNVVDQSTNVYGKEDIKEQENKAVSSFFDSKDQENEAVSSVFGSNTDITTLPDSCKSMEIIVPKKTLSTAPTVSCSLPRDVVATDSTSVSFQPAHQTNTTSNLKRGSSNRSQSNCKHLFQTSIHKIILINDTHIGWGYIIELACNLIVMVVKNDLR